MMSRLPSMLVGMVAMLSVVATTASYEPKPDIGYPAGLIPECPGVTKNITISLHTMPQLQVVLHRVQYDGQINRKVIPVTAAPRMMMKDKYIDFKRRKTVLYAVGFFDSSIFPHSQAVGTAYSRRGYNVLVSETFTLLTKMYPVSVRLARTIGEKMGEMLAKLTEQGLAAEDLELVGFSLGAHIASYAAKRFYSLTGKKPSRLTGLDPAGPCFRPLPRDMRFDSTDAVKVDVVHTNIDGFGIAESLGHVDFYANGGEFQPNDIPFIPCLIICSHLRAVLYWWQAIEHPKKFIGIKCDSVQQARFAKCYNNSVTNYVGIDTKFDRPGIYYLPTHNEFPYYRGKDGLKAENEIFTSIIKRINDEANSVV